MENNLLPNALQGTGNKNNFRLGIKLLVIAIISLLLLIPQAIIMDMVNERSNTEGLANLEVNEKWGNGQTLTGPVLFIPGDSAANNLYILPETLDIDGNINSRTLKRGIYDFTVYETALTLAGNFSLPKELKAEQLKSLRTDRAKLLFAISDFKGFSDNPALVLGGQPVELSSEALHLGSYDALSCSADLQSFLDSGTLDYRLTVPIKGSGYLYFLPAGRTTSVHLTSDCPTPSFTGRYLPSQRQVTDQGFTADWKVLALNRDFAQVLNSHAELKKAQPFGVDLKVPVEQYQQTTRSIKYAYLIILLTFAVVFFVEIRRQTPIHPVQYALVGIALMLFYTLLLAFSEHLTFLLSYLIASIMTIGLITLFMRTLLRNTRAALFIGLLLVVLYTFIYVIMQLESYALLVGSLGIFVILAVAMYASQKINWYQEKLKIEN
ncbi:MAG: cell envelope integrity protein CreD [Bacteroidales bacterium]|nr:cell envelope integrity protein CreD [Bacteroidales bacterium]